MSFKCWASAVAVAMNLLLVSSVWANDGLENGKCTDKNGMLIKNQTEDVVTKFLLFHRDNAATKNKEILGVGLYLIPAPEIGIMEEKVIAVEKIGYEEAVKRGQNTMAFKWFPYVATAKGENPAPWDTWKWNPATTCCQIDEDIKCPCPLPKWTDKTGICCKVNGITKCPCETDGNCCLVNREFVCPCPLPPELPRCCTINGELKCPCQNTPAPPPHPWDPFPPVPGNPPPVPGPGPGPSPFPDPSNPYPTPLPDRCHNMFCGPAPNFGMCSGGCICGNGNFCRGSRVDVGR